MLNPKLSWDRDYYFRARHGSIAGLVHKRQKIIHDIDSDALYRFNLKTDPKENKNRFRIRNPIDQKMLLRLMQHTPLRFVQHLEQRETQELLANKVASIKPGIDSRQLDFLLTLARKDPSSASMNAVRQVYEKYNHRGLRLAVIRHMFKEDPEYWSQKVADEIDQVAGLEDELELISQLSAQGQPHFSPKKLAVRMKWWIDHEDTSSWEPWLNLIDGWKNTSARLFGPLEIKMLRKIQALEKGRSPDNPPPLKPQMIRQVLDCLVQLRLQNKSVDKKQKKIMLQLAESFLSHDSIQVQVSAANVLGNLGDENSAIRLRNLLENEKPSIQVTQAALKGIYNIEGAKSLKLLFEYGQDQSLSLDVMSMIKKGRHKEGIPFLKEVAKNHSRVTVRDKAKIIAKVITSKSK